MTTVQGWLAFYGCDDGLWIIDGVIISPVPSYVNIYIYILIDNRHFRTEITVYWFWGISVISHHYYHWSNT